MQKTEVFKIITDEAQLDIPAYIDKPEYVRNKTAGYSLLALGWVMWMWLFLPLLTLLFWWFEGNLVYEQLIVAEMPKKPLNLFHLMGLITIFILCLFLWASYNWYRFRNNEKRLFPTHVESSNLAQSFSVSISDIEHLQQAENITLHYSEEGELKAYDLNDQVKTPTSKSMHVDVAAQNHLDNSQNA